MKNIKIRQAACQKRIDRKLEIDGKTDVILYNGGLSNDEIEEWDELMINDPEDSYPKEGENGFNEGMTVWIYDSRSVPVYGKIIESPYWDRQVYNVVLDSDLMFIEHYPKDEQKKIIENNDNSHSSIEIYHYPDDKENLIKTLESDAGLFPDIADILKEYAEALKRGW